MSEPKVYCVDIDGVLATLVDGNDYNKAGPRTSAIAAVNALYARGQRIILFTARGSKTGIDWTELTAKQLQEWGVNYHELHFGKPAADYYIDDRNMSVEQLEALDVE